MNEEKYVEMLENGELYDYITNLQQENKKLSKQHLATIDKLIETQQRIEKAVEYIKKEVIPYGNEWHWDDGGIRYYVEEVLNILEGKSDK